VLGGGATWLAKDGVTVKAVLTLAAPGTADGDDLATPSRATTVASGAAESGSSWLNLAYRRWMTVSKLEMRNGTTCRISPLMPAGSASRKTSRNHGSSPLLVAGGEWTERPAAKLIK